MPRIRKKTSKRGTTNKRARIQQKVAESRKKNKKASKKNPQWKSAHKKDPGIPNNFPYKDQILAEVAEDRRKAAEEKQRRKVEKRAVGGESAAGEQPGSDNEESGPSFGVASVNAKILSAVKKQPPAKVDNTQEDSVPILINHDLPNLQSALDSADVIIHVLDARDPLAFRSTHLEKLAAARPGVKILFVLNKIDTCPREAIVSWTVLLRSHHPTFLFRAASCFLPPSSHPVAKGKEKEKRRSDDGLGVDPVLDYLGRWTQEKGDESPLVVVVVGLTNVGKSSFINSLHRQAVLEVYTLSSSSPGPTTTTLPQEIMMEVSGRQIRVIDTPGLSRRPPDSENQNPPDADAIRTRDILLRNKGRIDRLKDPMSPITHIVSRSNHEDLMLFYNLPAFAKGDADAFLAGVARSHHLLRKHGILDLIGASRIVLRDWSTGKFARYTMAPPATSSPTDAAVNSEFADIYAKDEEILITLATRKEMRGNVGLVRFSAGEIDNRSLAHNEPWLPLEDEKSDDAEEDDADAASPEGDEDDWISEEEVIQPPSEKRNRKRSATESTAARPTKKVAFATNDRDLISRRLSDAPIRKESLRVPPTPKAKRLGSKDKKNGVSPTRKKGKVANKGAGPTHSKVSSKGSEAYDFSRYF